MRYHVATAALAVAGAFLSPTTLTDTYPKNPNIDALNYAFTIELSDTTDLIVGELALDVRFVGAGVRAVRLDLISASAAQGGKGMRVSGVTMNGTAIPFTHASDVLLVPLATAPVVNQRARLVVRYRGTPATGLKIGNNKYGDRTFFSDNWPDKARHWLPTIDHPYDKATSEFIVTAPSHYQVVSNGLQVEISDVPGGRRRTHWKNSVPIAPWLYVLGAARFAVQRVGTFDGKAIETWVYAQDRDAGFADFATPTKDVLAYYTDYVGPFAYERLANIQSNSVSGGMEAASAILYSESSVTGTGSVRWRNVVIHEIAHQWFGNAVTEADWDDVWLSEGFATYFTLLYIEHAYGRDEFVRGLQSSRSTVMSFAAKNPAYTIIHKNLSRMEDVTSSHTYQKGSWTLHMLRGVIGSEAFQRGIRAYYARHFNGNATTADFRRAMEEASGQELGWFFEQWLYKPGTLKVAGSWSYDAAARQVRLTLDQVQTDGSLFTMPLEIGVYSKGQPTPVIERVRMTARSNVFTINTATAPDSVRLDPNVWVLMDATFEKRP
ncbi:M1 family metallopeptidase [Gemmatimonas sp.]|jgi:aminopeptidase N|uniref:M1 family metallopeptidase n=1 Tax=Gemmatimonas sp. TaxID=1962908 RepID=UPI0037BEDE49